MDFFNILIVFVLIASTLQPLLQGRYLQMLRARQIAAIEKERGSRVITMIHRQETRSFFSVPVSRMIDLEDAQQIIPAIRDTPPDMPIDLILHTPGGMVLAAMQIARAIKAHPAKVSVHVPVYAMSGGTLLALAADEIVMEDFAVLGPIDPQIAGLPAASMVDIKAQKPADKISDLALLFANIAEKALRQVKQGAMDLVGAQMQPEKAKKLVDILAGGQWTHDYAVTASQAKEIGLNVRDGIPASIMHLMRLYPQPVRQTPSVEFLNHPARQPA
jgi:ClpP class serine protease